MKPPKQESVVDSVQDQLAERARALKPKLRGWLHLATAPLAFISFLVLLVLADRPVQRAGAAVFMVCAVGLFVVSAVYHTGTWRQGVEQTLRRVDHSNIFLMIAGSYTPFSLLLLEPRKAAIMLSLVWGGALLGVVFKIFWIGAPRWVYVPLYVMLGWAAVIYLPEFADAASTSILTLMAVGGLLYTIGALVYGFKWPDPHPAWFGFHEVFHSLTIAAFIVHYIGVSMLVYAN